MPKNLEVFPEKVFAPGAVKFTDIPVNVYKATIDEEKKKFSKQDFSDLWYDLSVCREFENILNTIKVQGSYKGVTYNHAGPAHLSIGQEAAAVGQCFALGIEDFILGSHRSHSEIMAKGLSAIRKLADADLMTLMKGYLNGDILRVVEVGHAGSVKDLARKFLVYGAYAEIFARETGFNRGLGGSMHTFLIPFGIFPNNAIVGGSASIAPGVALFKRVNKKPGIVIANIGDSSFGCGPVWEGIQFSAMDQYRTLWGDHGGGLPILFNCMNNHYGMGGQTSGETMGYGMLARVGAGVNPEQMHAERINGYDPLAVIDAIERKKKILLDGKGPVLLDTVTYRVSGHSPSDASSYRSKEEIERWAAADANLQFRQKLIKNGILTEKEVDGIKTGVDDFLFAMFKDAVDLQKSPRTPIQSEYVGSVLFSNQKVEKFDDRAPELLQAGPDNPRVAQIAGKVRSAFDDAGAAVPKMKQYNLRDGLFEAMLHRYKIDPTLVAFGEENRDWGGAFAVYRGLTEAIPYHRLFNSPISEAAIVGAAIGYALAGGRAVCELMYCDFLGRSGDEVFNQLSKWQAMSAGILRMPVVLRVSVGAKYGAQHSQDWSSLINHIPGLKAVYPVTPYDAKGMLNAALAGTDPVVFFESQKLYDQGELFEKTVPEGYYEVPMNQPALRRSGEHLTVVTLGPALYTALGVADRLQKEWNVSAEVIDLRAITPVDLTLITESVRKTGRLLLVTEAVERGSLMHNIASAVTRICFSDLDAPPVVVGSRNWITPAAELEAMYFPQASWILDAIHESLLPLDGYAPVTNANELELLRRYKDGN